MVAELVRAQVAAGMRCSIAVLDNAGRGNRQVLEECRTLLTAGVVLPCRRALDLSAVAALRRLTHEQKVSLVHSHKYKCTTHALLARRAGPVPLVATCHNWLTDTTVLRFYGFFDRIQCRFCDAVVAVSRDVEDKLKRTVPSRKVHRIGNGVDVARFLPHPDPFGARAALGLPEPTRATVGFVGRLTAFKGVGLLVEALADLPRDQRPLLLIVGDGPIRAELERQRHELNVADDVLLLGERRDTLSLYPAFDAFVLPSFVEAFPMVILEAFACGVPVIGTRVGDVPDMIRDGENGLLCNAGQREELRACLASVACVPERWSAMRVAARRCAETLYSSARMARSYQEVYERVLA